MTLKLKIAFLTLFPPGHSVSQTQVIFIFRYWSPNASNFNPPFKEHGQTWNQEFSSKGGGGVRFNLQTFCQEDKKFRSGQGKSGGIGEVGYHVWLFEEYDAI